MIDVHPAPHAAHSWRDFFIHIATIAIGLLLALGLEQTVEHFHRLHQRHSLEENLHSESLLNRRIVGQKSEPTQYCLTVPKVTCTAWQSCTR